jgi:hypothetical protein
MFEFAVVAWLVGAALSVQFTLFALVPALSVLLVFLVLGEVSRGEAIGSTVAAMLLVAISAQLGYFAGSVLQFLAGNWRRGKADPVETTLSLQRGFYHHQNSDDFPCENDSPRRRQHHS